MIGRGPMTGADFNLFCPYCWRENLDTEACPNSEDICTRCCGENHRDPLVWTARAKLIGEVVLALAIVAALWALAWMAA